MIELLDRQQSLTINQWKIFTAVILSIMLDFFDFLLIGFVLLHAGLAPDLWPVGADPVFVGHRRRRPGPCSSAGSGGAGRPPAKCS